MLTQSPVPISGFCSGFTLEKRNSGKGFITVQIGLAELVDRGKRYSMGKLCHLSCCREVTNTQRFVFLKFKRLSDVFITHGILPSGGQLIEKIS